MFRASKDILKEALDLAGSCISATHAIPIYTHLLLEGEGGDLWLTGSDGEVTIVTCVTEATVAGDFSTCVPAKHFIDLVGLLGGEFSFEEKDGRVIVKHGRASQKIPCLPKSAYPEVQGIEGESITLAGNLLRRMIDATEIAVDHKPDGKFPAMRGLNLVVAGDSLHLVGADGVRMAVASTPMKGDVNVIIPQKAVQVFGKFADGTAPVEIIPQENQISLRGENGNVLSKRLTGTYPDWRLAIPQNLLYHAEMSVPALILAIRRVGLASNIRDSMHSPAFSLRFTISETELMLESQSDKGEAIEFVDIKCPGLKEEIVVGVAGRQILDFLGVVSTGELILSFRDAQTGLQFKPKSEFGFEYKYITMPVNLKWGAP